MWDLHRAFKPCVGALKSSWVSPAKLKSSFDGSLGLCVYLFIFRMSWLYQTTAPLTVDLVLKSSCGLCETVGLRWKPGRQHSKVSECRGRGVSAHLILKVMRRCKLCNPAEQSVRQPEEFCLLLYYSTHVYHQADPYCTTSHYATHAPTLVLEDYQNRWLLFTYRKHYALLHHLLVLKLLDHRLSHVVNLSNCFHIGQI